MASSALHLERKLRNLLDNSIKRAVIKISNEVVLIMDGDFLLEDSRKFDLFSDQVA